MNGIEVLAAVLLWTGVALLVLSCAGSLLLRDVRDRLHLVALAAVAGAPLAGAGLALTAESWRSGLKVLLVVALLAGTAPATSAVTARAVRGGRS